MDANRLLDQLVIASPCTRDWNSMSGHERTRYCAECQKNVYNISELTREEALRLIVEQEGSLCVRLYRRTDGTVMTADWSSNVAQNPDPAPAAQGRHPRRFQFRLSMLMAFMVLSAATLGLARLIPPRWIELAQGWWNDPAVTTKQPPQPPSVSIALGSVAPDWQIEAIKRMLAERASEKDDQQ